MKVQYPSVIVKDPNKKIWKTEHAIFLSTINEIIEKVKETYNVILNHNRIIRMFTEYLSAIHCRLSLHVLTFECELEDEHMYLIFFIDGDEIACTKVFYYCILENNIDLSEI